MKDKKTKQNSLKKIAFIILFAFSFSLAPLPAKKADAWLSIPAAIVNAGLKTLLEMIQKVLVGALKQVAATTINQMVSKIAGGGASGGAMFITDWQDYLIKQPARNTQLYMNSYLTQMTQGKGNISGYTPNRAFEGTGPGSFNTGMSQYGNYFSRLVADTQSTLGRSLSPPTYQGNPAQMFAKGNMKDLSTYVSGNNSPWAFKWNAKAEEMQSLEEERDLYMAKSIAGGGFTGKEVGGKTVTPGAVVRDSLSNSEDLGNKIIAGASSLPEVLTAVVTKLVTKSIQNGVGNVQARVQAEITDVTNRNITQMQNAVRTSGPGALYRR